MDGVKKRTRRSLQMRLSMWLALAVLLSAVAAGIFSFSAAFDEANDVQDGQLEEIASLLTADNLDVMETGSRRYVPTREPEAKVVVQRLGDAGGAALLHLPAHLADGIQTRVLDGREWRIVVRTLAADSRVAIAQQTSDRDEIAINSAIATLVPFAVLAPLLVCVVFLLVRRMFRPLVKLAAELDARSDHDLSRITGADDMRLPAEIMPFLVANNRLFSRVLDAMAMQRRFVADAAHELRSPLTVLTLQAERLSLSDMSAEARERFIALRAGLARARALIEQLLTLARMQDETVAQVQSVSIGRVLRLVLEELMPLAESRQLDIGMVEELDAQVPAGETDLTILLKNLVDNAIRYTPHGGRIDISMTRDAEFLHVHIDDTGPGIAPDERERVFDRFYRVLGTGQTGSGLGLAIVQTIATRIGARVQLGDARWPDHHSGLRVTVSFSNRSLARPSVSNPAGVGAD
ncbi:integral membrane sensor signal transduction histidine kinase [Caballeronia sordidicola]|uniref:histidine kinase n=1 Tax=Caballeronia sordidicola TaxID=196367 RepID=A0A158G6M9_CABSO|nr:ATP-binding protein [Caballeronia sordidicola]SAL27521.1 integral membrane sensor signal transduction histidine kinase [Caballeronia sordidicola]